MRLARLNAGLCVCVCYTVMSGESEVASRSFFPSSVGPMGDADKFCVLQRERERRWQPPPSPREGSSFEK